MIGLLLPLIEINSLLTAILKEVLCATSVDVKRYYGLQSRT